jgi:hypothetical protein
MKKDSSPDRRSVSRNAASIDLEFHVWDVVEKKPLTRKLQGRLTNISPKGACLQISQPLIDGYHLMRDNDLEGGTPLVLDLPASPRGGPFTIKSQILWYNRIDPEGPFHFNVGLKFVDISPTERKQLEDLIRSTSTPPKG